MLSRTRGPEEAGQAREVREPRMLWAAGDHHAPHRSLRETELGTAGCWGPWGSLCGDTVAAASPPLKGVFPWPGLGGGTRSPSCGGQGQMETLPGTGSGGGLLCSAESRGTGVTQYPFQLSDTPPGGRSPDSTSRTAATATALRTANGPGPAACRTLQLSSGSWSCRPGAVGPPPPSPARCRVFSIL